MTNIVDEATTVDTNIRKLFEGYSRVKIKANLEMAKMLREMRDKKLYLKLDDTAYPSFSEYLKSVGIVYKTATEWIGIYEAYVLSAGVTIDELATKNYRSLLEAKSQIFSKENGNYVLAVPKKELQKKLADAGSGMTSEDFKQKLNEEKAGPHEHDWQIIKFKKCKICKLKEYGQ